MLTFCSIYTPTQHKILTYFEVVVLRVPRELEHPFNILLPPSVPKPHLNQTGSGKSSKLSNGPGSGSAHFCHVTRVTKMTGGMEKIKAQAGHVLARSVTLQIMENTSKYVTSINETLKLCVLKQHLSLWGFLVHLRLPMAASCSQVKISTRDLP